MSPLALKGTQIQDLRLGASNQATGQILLLFTLVGSTVETWVNCPLGFILSKRTRNIDWLRSKRLRRNIAVLWGKVLSKYIPGPQTRDCWQEGGEVGRRGAEASSVRPGTFINSARILLANISEPQKISDISLALNKQSGARGGKRGCSVQLCLLQLPGRVLAWPFSVCSMIWLHGQWQQMTFWQHS